MTPLQERLQSEAREKMLEGCVSHFAFFQKYLLGDHKDLDALISHTISETLKEAVRVIEGERDERDYLAEGFPEATENEKDGYNQGIDSAITAVEGLMITNNTYDHTTYRCTSHTIV